MLPLRTAECAGCAEPARQALGQVLLLVAAPYDVAVVAEQDGRCPYSGVPTS